MAYWVVKPAITYATLVWWLKTNSKLTLAKISTKVYLGITGAMRTTPTVTVEILLDLPSLDLVIQREARRSFHKLQNPTLSNLDQLFQKSTRETFYRSTVKEKSGGCPRYSQVISVRNDFHNMKLMWTMRG